MTTGKRFLLQLPVPGLLQHLAFWVLSCFVFLQQFKTGNTAEKIDYIYTALFQLTLLPAVYLNLKLLLPRLAYNRRWVLYLPAILIVIALFSWLNYSFFQNWSAYLLPDYFFISYFSIWQVSLFFIIYIIITSLLKFSKSWFHVNELERQLLQTEKEKVQIELQALKAQVNPHFFFNTLNGLYSMSLDKDERLPGSILQLSHLMRYFLYEANEELVPLEKEWQVLQDYIALQQIRSGKTVQVEKLVEGDIKDQEIAPFLLVTFLENAFKHGAESNIIQLLLKVNGNDFTFKVENKKGEIDEVEPNRYKGVGLQNVRRRLELLYPGKHRLKTEEDGEHFIVTLQLTL